MGDKQLNPDIWGHHWTQKPCFCMQVGMAAGGTTGPVLHPCNRNVRAVPFQLFHLRCIICNSSIDCGAACTERFCGGESVSVPVWGLDGIIESLWLEKSSMIPKPSPPPPCLLTMSISTTSPWFLNTSRDDILGRVELGYANLNLSPSRLPSEASP